MEKSNTKEFLRVAIITFITSILLLFALLTLQINGVFVQIGTPPNGISHQALSNLLIIVAIVSLIYLFNDRGIKGNNNCDRGIFHNSTVPSKSSNRG